MLKKYKAEGASFPKFYGFGYFDHSRQVTVCYPVPLNYIIAIAYNGYWFVASKSVPLWFNKKVFEKSRNKCNEKCYVRGCNNRAEIDASVFIDGMEVYTDLCMEHYKQIDGKGIK